MPESNPNNLPLREAAGFVIYRDQAGQREYLLLRSAKWDEWSLAKGHADPEDTDILAAACRELREETGLVDVLMHTGFRHVLEYQPEGIEPPYWKRVTYFLARHDRGQIKLSDEHTRHTWLAPDAAREAFPHQDMREVIEASENFLQSV